MVVNGWTIFAHPLFLDQLELLTQQVEAFRQKDAIGFVKKNATKRLAAIAKLAFEVIPLMATQIPPPMATSNSPTPSAVR